MSKAIAADHVIETVALDVPYDVAFDFIADPRTGPEWAVKFVRDVAETPDGLMATVPFGTVPVSYDVDKASGVIDMTFGDGPALPTRLVHCGAGCVYIFHLNRTGDIPDAAWQEGAANLREEMRMLKHVLEEKAGG